MKQFFKRKLQELWIFLTRDLEQETFHREFREELKKVMAPIYTQNTILKAKLAHREFKQERCEFLFEGIDSKGGRVLDGQKPKLIQKIAVRHKYEQNPSDPLPEIRTN